MTQNSKILSTNQSLAAKVVYLNLVTQNEGLLLPWLGPAIRGTILRPLRDHFCSAMGGRETSQASGGLKDWQAKQETAIKVSPKKQSSEYCTGCIKNKNCSYGRVFEPDLKIIDPALIQRNDAMGVRGISIAAEMMTHGAAARAGDSIQSRGKVDSQEAQIAAPAGTTLLVRLLALGEESRPLLPTVVQAIDELGRTNGLGYQAPVHFQIDPAETTFHDWQLDPGSLSIETDRGTIPEVTINFESPLLLKSCLVHGRLVPPTFNDLFRNAVRITIRAIREFASPEFLASVSMKSFFEEARVYDATQPKGEFHQREYLLPFMQSSISHRGCSTTRKRYRQRCLRGWLGSITWHDVPVTYLPWLIWGGRLGVGSDRNRGAGLWRVTI